jgi:hypothetical protein
MRTQRVSITHCIMDIWRSGGIAPPMTTALDGGSVVSFIPRPLSGERAPGTHWIGGWVGPRAGLNAVE